MNRYRQRDATSFAFLAPEDSSLPIARHIKWLVGIFFGLCLVLWTLTIVADQQQPGVITIYVWGRVVTESVLGTAFFLFMFLWWRGKFWGYLRMLMTSALALVSAVSVVILAGNYPWWLRLEQAIQAAVAAVLLYKLTRPVMRHRFAKKSSEER